MRPPGRSSHLDLELPVEVADRIDRPQRQRLVQRELVLEIEIDPHPSSELVGRVGELEQVGIDERSVDRDRTSDVLTLAASGLVVLDHQSAYRCATVARSIEEAHHHLVVDVEARRQRLGFTVHQPVERVLVPVGVPAVRRLLPDHLLALLGVGLGLLGESLVVDDVLGRLGPDVAAVVEPPSPGTPGDLLELAHAQQADPAAVVLAQLGEQHRPDRDVDPDAERVGAADDLQQSGLRQPLDQQSVLGEQSGVVHADPGHQEPTERLAER